MSGICRLVLDRPDRANALDADTVEGLHAALERAEEDRASLVVFEARGSAFCSGLDLTDLDQETDATLLHRLVRIQLFFERIARFPAPTVALVEAPAVGAGADLVLATSVRLAVSTASLRFPGSGFGAVLGVGRLSAETAPSYAAEVALTGRKVTAAEAERQGLWRVLDTRVELDAEVNRLAADADRLPHGTVARLRSAAVPSLSRDPLGDLVRSLATTPGLRDRVDSYRTHARTLRIPKPQPLGGTR